MENLGHLLKDKQISPQKLTEIVAKLSSQTNKDLSSKQEAQEVQIIEALQEVQIIEPQQPEQQPAQQTIEPPQVQINPVKEKKGKKDKKKKHESKVHFTEMIIFYVDEKDDEGNVTYEHSDPFYRLSWKELKRLLLDSGHDYDITRDGLTDRKRAETFRIKYLERRPGRKGNMRQDDIRLFCRIEANCSHSIVEQIVERVTSEFNHQVEQLQKTREEAYKHLCGHFYSKLLQGFFLRQVNNALVPHPAQLDLLDPKKNRTFDTTDLEVMVMTI